MYGKMTLGYSAVIGSSCHPHKQAVIGLGVLRNVINSKNLREILILKSSLTLEINT